MSVNGVEKSFCTTREAADLLGVSVGTVQLWVERGLLEAWKTDGGHRRVLRASIDQLLHKPAVKSQEAKVAGPVVQSLSGSPLEGSAVVNGARRLRVMVVEDDPNLLLLYKTQISRWPMQPEWIGLNNGFAALLALGRSCPDLLILDLHLPEMDGFGMLRVLHNAPEISRMRVVVVTGMDSRGIEAKGGLPEGIEVLPKPIPFERLRTIAIEMTANMDTGTDRS